MVAYNAITVVCGKCKALMTLTPVVGTPFEGGFQVRCPDCRAFVDVPAERVAAYLEEQE